MERSMSTHSANFSASDTFAGGDPGWYDHALSHLADQPRWPTDKERAIMEPYDYLSALPGKEVRTRLIEAFNVWLQVPSHKLEAISRVVSMLHNASLLMDDVEDNSDLRRGIPVAHKIYGIPQTINTANYVYFKVLSDIFTFTKAGPSNLNEHDAEFQARPPTTQSSASSVSPQPRLSPVNSGTATPTESDSKLGSASAKLGDPSAQPFTDPSSRISHGSLNSLPSSGSRQSVESLVVEEMINLHRGQGMDLFWRDSLICPTEGEYVEMVNNKTGGLFRIALKLMMTQSPVLADQRADGSQRRYDTGDAGVQPAFPDLIPLANVIGLLFQIRDDYMNLQSDQYTAHKGFCEDLTEGKFSFPIIHSVRASAATTSSSTIPPNRQILNVLKQRPTDEATKSYAVAYMRDQTHSFTYTRSVLRRLDAQARREIDRIANQWTAAARPRSSAPSAPDEQRTNARLVSILDVLRGGWWEQSEKDLTSPPSS
ncbi:hypothetical protein OC845_004761 [Tilletia horrida]|nr:hypothetical protein OC845_004761 [Tilletia horrida]